MVLLQMENAQVMAAVDEHASEIHSFRRKDSQLEYMWQGDPAYWSGRNPTLFPVVGSTWDKKLHINGKDYETGNHGFARHSDFTGRKTSESEIVMTLKDNEETRKQYPFAFTLENTYQLHESTLTITSSVTNDNDVVMPFNHGFHPAFRCPLKDDEAQSDYYLLLNHPEDFEAGGKHYSNVTRIDLDPVLLEQTIILNQPESTSFTLTNGTHGVRVDAKGYPWVAFWSKPGPFVCIEPWHSHTDFMQVKVPFEKREGTILLDPHQKWSTVYSITVF